MRIADELRSFVAFQWPNKGRQTFQLNAIAAVGSNREKQREQETEQSFVEIMARGVYLCVRVLARACVCVCCRGLSAEL